MRRFILLLTAIFIINVPGTAQERECPVAELTLGETVTSPLEAADCKYSDIVQGSTLGNLVKRYKVAIRETRVLILGMTATGFTPQLLLYGNGGARLIGFSAGTAASPRSRIAAHLPAGEYTIFAMASRADVAGTFELKGDTEAVRTCPADQTLPLDGAIEGSFDASSCRALDRTPFSTSEAYLTFYRATMPRAAVLDIRAETAVAAFSMVLTNEALTAFRGQRSVLASLNPGQLVFSVSSINGGSYTLRSAISDRRVCEQKTLTLGEETAVDLPLAGCRVLDYRVPSGDARPLALYRMSTTSPTVVDLNQKSVLHDSRAFLFDARGTLITSADEGFEGEPERILINLPPGGYVVGASIYEDNTGAAVTMKVTGEKPRECDTAAIAPGETVTQQIPESGCRLLDYLSFSEDQILVSPFKFEPAAKGLFKFEVTGLNEGFVEGATPQGRALFAAFADRNGAANPEMIMLPGTHMVLFGTESDTDRPTFTVKLTSRDIPACDTGTLALNTELNEVLTAVECKAHEIIPYFPIAVSAKAFRLDLPQRGRTVMSIDTAAFTPFLAVTQGSDTLLAAVTRPGPGSITLTGTGLAAGEYRLIVGTLTTLGAYKLKAEFTPDGAVASASADGDGGAPEFGVRTAAVEEIHAGGRGPESRTGEPFAAKQQHTRRTGGRR